MTKVLTVRLEDDAGADLAVIARVKKSSMAETFREAVDEYIARHHDDPEFQAQLKRQARRERKAYKRLAGEEMPD